MLTNVFYENLASMLENRQQAKEHSDLFSKIEILNLRCQSLTNLKLYKMKRQEVKNCRKTISEYLATSKSTASSTIEIQNEFQWQTTFFQFLEMHHDLWDKAEETVSMEKHSIFFKTLDRDNRPITQRSSIDHLVEYVLSGLDELKKIQIKKYLISSVSYNLI